MGNNFSVDASVDQGAGKRREVLKQKNKGGESVQMGSYRQFTPKKFKKGGLIDLKNKKSREKMKEGEEKTAGPLFWKSNYQKEHQGDKSQKSA